MSPVRREPKYAYGAFPIAIPSGCQLSGSWIVVGLRCDDGWAEAGDTPTVVTATAVRATIARVRLETDMISFQAARWSVIGVYPTVIVRVQACTHCDTRIY